MEILRIAFEEEKLKITLRMAEPFNTRDKPHLARGLFRLLPRLKKHRCFNDGNLSFQREAAATEIAHLMEHLVLELQAVTLCGRGIRGVTYWNWREEPMGQFHVDVDAPHTAVALGAVWLAQRIIRAVDERCPERIDVEQELRVLRRLAQLPSEALPRVGIENFARWEEDWVRQVAELLATAPDPSLVGVPG
ncbi:MAG: hypothetical protein GX774_21450 [Armatimonadetes bacterium]|nr:hypothetical protein [Armatimonadota bacterium]